MAILKPGDVATVLFVGAEATKRRPVVVISAEEYQHRRPDVIVALLTSNLDSATTPFDYVLLDWASAGLKRPSAFRAYLQTDLQAEVARIGRLSEGDWIEIRGRLSLLFGLT